MQSTRTPSRISLFLNLLAVWLVAAAPARGADVAQIDLDVLVDAPKCWELTPEAFEKHFSAERPGMFRWLTSDHTRAIFSRTLYSDATIGLSMLEKSIPVEEVVVDFAGGKLNLVTISVFNRGDARDITLEEFKRRHLEVGKAVGAKLGVKPYSRSAGSGLLTEGFGWESPNGMAVLECNVGATTGKDREFLRLRMARRDAPGALAASMKARGTAAVRLGDLPGNVTKDDKGNVFIGNMPMADQGSKGYCLPASIQRVFEYYGMGTDMHQIAEVAGSDPKVGTSALLMAKELDKIDYHFKTRLVILGLGAPGKFNEVEVKKGEYYVGKPVDEKKFLKDIKGFIDDGIPLLWTLKVGVHPEEPEMKMQTTGFHMRLIIGYNENDNRLIFTDSWGAGHEFKSIKAEHAFDVTNGVFVLKPTVR
jgi:hypothetical protein